MAFNVKKKKRRFPKLYPSLGGLFKPNRHSHRGILSDPKAISDCRRNRADSFISHSQIADFSLNDKIDMNKQPLI
jgi:hypothetical protein